MLTGKKSTPERISGSPPASFPPSTTTAAEPPTTPLVQPTLSGFEFYSATVQVPPIAVREWPDPASPVRVTLGERNENGGPQVFLIKAEQLGSDGLVWYRVLLPMRPNGSRGWVPASDVTVTGIDDQLVVHLSQLRLDLFERGQRRRSFVIGVGTDRTPTPGGEYYLKELLQPPDRDTLYGDYVFGLSGFSNVLTSWPQGGVLGIHGTNDPTHSIGRKVSHGCIRLANRNIDWLASFLPLGTPVEVDAQ